MPYEFDGKKYQESSAHQKEWGTRLIVELKLRGDERVLDLGCGDGVLTALLAELVPNGGVIGMDASLGMIETAQKHQVNNLRFLQADIRELPFANEFDVIFSNAALHWIKDHRPLLNQGYNALRRGGMIRFNFGGEGNCINFLKIIREAIVHTRFSKYFVNLEWPWYMPGVKEYESLMAETRFRDVQVWLENADRFFPDAETMIKWVDQPSLVPFMTAVDEIDKTAFRQWVVDGMIAATRQADGRCFETFRRLNVFARK